jgi:hypothetical protein
MSELDEIMNGKIEMRGFRVEGDTIGFDTQKHANWNLNPRDIENIIYTLQQELDQYKNNWEELKKWLKEDKEYAGNNFEMGRCFNMFNILNKMKELEEDK